MTQSNQCSHCYHLFGNVFACSREGCPHPTAATILSKIRKSDMAQGRQRKACAMCGVYENIMTLNIAHLIGCPNDGQITAPDAQQGIGDKSNGVADRVDSGNPRKAVGSKDPASSTSPVPFGNILDEAIRIIYGDREKTYGSPDKNLNTISNMWSDYIHAKNPHISRIVLSVDDVCLMMILLKVARLANDPAHRDSQVDLAGYAALMERVQNHVKNLKL